MNEHGWSSLRVGNRVGQLNNAGPSLCEVVQHVSDLGCISQVKGAMNTLGVPLDGEASESSSRGSPINGPHSVDDDVGAYPNVCDCSLIGANSNNCKTCRVD